ncbi:patched family protein [Dictyocaulus viviparus]|uniref:Patched family protein n=1 Tax=Dictyocaulus viviparus TaxID=29172 RepID=A0A0D8XKU7_DICVI|nr:patched family protein [Dictyocaulus viviparus]
MLSAKDNRSMIRFDYLEETVQILDLTSSRFLIHDSNLGTNQSFREFCGGFCQANEPVRQYYNGMRVLQENTSVELKNRINLTYPTSEMFSTKISLLPHFYGVELYEDGKSLKSVSLIVLIFRAEKHLSWTPDAAKDWELNVDKFFGENYNQTKIEVNVLSQAVIERDVVRAGEYLQPFLLVGFTIMGVFCVATTIFSSVIMYGQKITFNKALLAITACIVPFLACGTAFGLMFLFGVRFSPILCITPFLVLAISVDDAFLMIHAWNRIDSEDINYKRPRPRGQKIAQSSRTLQVLVETGPAIAISAITNILAFASGGISSTPEIRIFCIGNATCIFIDMCYQLTFYTAIMTLFADSSQFVDKENFSNAKRAAQKLLRCEILKSKYGLKKRFVLQSDRIRKNYITPSYTPATIIVNNPGNLSDPENIRELFTIKQAFENLPDAIGPESTKLFLSDYIKFKQTLEDEGSNAISIEEFLKWPEYSYWKGFIKMPKKLKRFNLSVFTEDAFYVDLLEAIPAITWQTAVATFISVIIVCTLFIKHAATVVFVAASIFATCIGMFSYMSLFGMTLDPIIMSISIMCIGFSVDIPAHVSFHYNAAESHMRNRISCSTFTSVSEHTNDDFKSRLQHTLRSVGYPVIQAGVSTNLCVLPLAFVPLYMAKVFSCAMLLCISISLIHGILILPAMFCLYDRALIQFHSWISSREKQTDTPI